MAADKMLICAVGTERLWGKFVEALDVKDTIGADERFAANANRNENRDVLIPLLEDVLKTRVADEWVEKLVAEASPRDP